MANAKEKRKVMLTPVGRLCFPSIFEKEKRRMKDSQGEPKYVATLVFDKEYLKTHPDELARYNAMKKNAEEVCLEKFKKPIKEAAAKIANFNDPFRDGAQKDHLDGFGEGTIFVKFTSNFKPGVVGSDARTPIDDPDALYPGCYARISTGAWAYDNRSKGIGFNMNNVMFVRDGERLDGRGAADADFGELAGVAADSGGDDLL